MSDCCFSSIGLVVGRGNLLASRKRVVPTYTLSVIKVARQDSIRFVVATTEKGWRGGEQQASLLVEGLSRRGIECGLIVREGSEFHRRNADGPLPLLAIAGRGKSPKQLFQIRRWLAQFQPQVLYWNDPHAMTSVGLAALGMPALRLVARRTSFPLKSPLPYRMLAHHVVCVSDAVAQQCIQDGICAESIRVIHDGVAQGDYPLPEVARFSLALPPHDRVVSCVAALSEEKNQKTLIDAWARVPEVTAGRRNVLLMAGAGACHDALQAQIRSLHLCDRVTLMGYRSDVDKILAATDLFVMPSLREGLCSAGIQALTAGCRMLLAKTGGLPELIASLPTSLAALIAEPTNATEWSEAITAMLQTPCPSGGQSRLRARGQYFSVDRMVNDTLALARSVESLRAAG
jgi:glycosyltransferase involved in cell wall biosynthesis